MNCQVRCRYYGAGTLTPLLNSQILNVLLEQLGQFREEKLKLFDVIIPITSFFHLETNP